MALIFFFESFDCTFYYNLLQRTVLVERNLDGSISSVVGDRRINEATVLDGWWKVSAFFMYIHSVKSRNMTIINLERILQFPHNSVQYAS